MPAIVVPAGFDPDGLPVGVELLGAAFAEPELITLGYALEQPHAIGACRPPLRRWQRVSERWTSGS